MAKIQGLATTGPLHILTGSSGATASVDGDELIIEGSTNAGISILVPDDGSIATLYMGGPSNSIEGGFEYTPSTNLFQVYAANEEIFRMNAAGIIFNKNGLSGHDFTIESDTLAALFHLNAGDENIIINGSTSAASSKGNLHINNGTSPSAALAGGIVIGAKDSSVGSTDATLEIWLETAPIAVGTFTASHKIPIWFNGVEYHLELDAV
ncbi:hypothetical protein LCGC14_2693380 [marine sediment metagenome]|uniref:Uncharacterized protein n=1 Tax=marine sediment metagenome TaxID=412755 RepID=A0A0F9A5E4_9ZZZZ